MASISPSCMAADGPPLPPTPFTVSRAPTTPMNASYGNREKPHLTDRIKRNATANTSSPNAATGQAGPSPQHHAKRSCGRWHAFSHHGHLGTYFVYAAYNGQGRHWLHQRRQRHQLSKRRRQTPRMKFRVDFTTVEVNILYDSRMKYRVDFTTVLYVMHCRWIQQNATLTEHDVLSDDSPIALFGKKNGITKEN